MTTDEQTTAATPMSIAERAAEQMGCDTCSADVWIGRRPSQPRVVMVEMHHANDCPTWLAMTAAEK